MAKMFVSLSDNTCANDVIDNDVTENDVIDSWMNMHTLLANRPNVVASTRRNRCERGLTHVKIVPLLHATNIRPAIA